MDEGVRTALAASSLARLPISSTQRLLTRSRVAQIPAGSVIHPEGETDDHLELVVDGLVRAFVTAPDGRTLTVRYCRQGALIGVVSMYATGFRMLRVSRRWSTRRCCGSPRTWCEGQRTRMARWPRR